MNDNHPHAVKMPVYYRPEMSATNSKSFSPSASKPKLAVEDWLADPFISERIEVHSFEPATIDDLCLAHSREYVEGVMSLKDKNGFDNRDREVADSLPYTTGSMIAAATHVLTRKMPGRRRYACSPTSGFHHANYDRGGGFCTFNGLMVTAIKMHQLGLAKRILILDLDAHYGDGTDDIIKRLGIDFVDNVTIPAWDHDPASIKKMARTAYDAGEGYYDLMLFQAGADLHIDDPLRAGLLSTLEMEVRDRYAFYSAKAANVPTVWNLAGGYQSDEDGGIGPVLALHRQTVMACLDHMK